MENINLFEILLTLLLGVVGYFLKRTMGALDNVAERVRTLEHTTTDRETFKELENKIDKRFDIVQSDIKDIRSDCISKSDFVTEISKLDRKIDKILDIVIERGGNNG